MYKRISTATNIDILFPQRAVCKKKKKKKYKNGGEVESLLEESKIDMWLYHSKYVSTVQRTETKEIENWLLWLLYYIL